MTSKERVLLAVNHKEPDRIPITASFTPEFSRILRRHLNLPIKPITPHGGKIHDLEEILGLDIIQYAVGMANSFYASEEKEYICEWGIKWKQVEYKTRFGKGYYTEIANHPLADDSEIKNYIPPDPHREELYQALNPILGTYGQKYCIMGVTVCTIFESSWYLRGMAKLLLDMVENEEVANYIMDIPFKFHLEAAKILTRMGVDMIWLGDDMGTQRGMLISPQLWRKYLKSRMAKICDELKKINPD